MHDSELKILSSFFPVADKIYTTKEIERISGYSHERVHTILCNLEKNKVLTRRNLGKVNIYKLNKGSSQMFLAYVFAIEKRKNQYFTENPERAEFYSKIVKLLGTKCNAIIALPSLGEIICISENGISDVNIVDGRTKIKLLTPDELRSIVQDKELYANIVRNGLILSGIDFVFRTIYREVPDYEI